MDDEVLEGVRLRQVFLLVQEQAERTSRRLTWVLGVGGPHGRCTRRSVEEVHRVHPRPTGGEPAIHGTWHDQGLGRGSLRRLGHNVGGGWCTGDASATQAWVHTVRGAKRGRARNAHVRDGRARLCRAALSVTGGV